MDIHIDALYYNAVDLLKQMIAIPSLSRDEEELANLIEAYIRHRGLFVNRKGNNVWIQSSDFDPSKPCVLLNSHIDTVKPVSAWTKDPFSPFEENGKLYGLGSNDAGASVVSLLHAFFYLDKKPRSYNLIYLASCEEEISGKNGVESILDDFPCTPAFAIVGEPTLMQPAVAEKGLMVLDCTSIGKSGHAARDEGDNAIYKAMKDIDWFQSYQFPKASDLLGAVKMSVTMINAGTQHNVIPDRCEFVVDVRSNECYTNQEIYEIICNHTQCEVYARSFRLNSSSIALDNPFTKRAILMGLQPYGSPTLSDQALMPFPSLKMGPGDSARSHTANEYIELFEIREAIEYYIKLLEGLQI